MPESEFQTFSARILQDAKQFSRQELAAVTKYSVRELSRLLNGEVKANAEAILRIQKAIQTFKQGDQEKEEILSKVKIISDLIGLRKFASQAKIDAGNLANVLKGNRNLSTVALGKIQTAIAEIGQTKSSEI